MTDKVKFAIGDRVTWADGVRAAMPGHIDDYDDGPFEIVVVMDVSPRFIATALHPQNVRFAVGEGYSEVFSGVAFKKLKH